MMEECSLCSRTLRSYSLVRCFSRRLVSPLKPSKRRTKYSPLRDYLARRPSSIKFATLTFPEIEKLIEDKLPFSALQHRHWWNNTDNSTQARSWSYAGWKVHNIDLNNKTVVFQRTKTAETELTTKRKKRSRRSVKKAFQLPTPRTPRRKLPSQTRIAMTIARSRNVERRRLAMRRYRGKFKPRSALEKQLYRPEARPEKFDQA